MPAVLNFVHVAVVKDKLRFARAQMAEAAVRTCASERGFEPRDVEYVLNASSEVAEFRSGMWNLLYDDYCTRVRQLVAVHCALGRCYRCLLSCDGNARLKAKRIVGKILRNGQFDTAVVVRALEGNLWWAKSRTNVKKMEEMGRRMQKIRA